MEISKAEITSAAAASPSAGGIASDGVTLPVLSPNGRYMAVQTGVAPDLATALQMDEENQDWELQNKDYDNSSPDRVTGAWAGDTAYNGEDLS